MGIQYNSVRLEKIWPMELKVKLEVFEGPLDLLLHLLDKNKVSIYDIPIVEITNQYLEYIREMQRQDLNIMSEFLVMAATLLEIKSKWLLPKEETEDEDEVDPRAELMEQLLQYKLFKYMSQELKDRQIDAGRRLYKNQSIPEEVRSYEEPLDLEELTRGWDLKKLHAIFESVMRKQVDKMAWPRWTPSKKPRAMTRPFCSLASTCYTSKKLFTAAIRPPSSRPSIKKAPPGPYTR